MPNDPWDDDDETAEDRTRVLCTRVFAVMALCFVAAQCWRVWA